MTESIEDSEIRESKGQSGIMKNNNRDSTEIKKTKKDSEVIQNLLITVVLCLEAITCCQTRLKDYVILNCNFLM